MKSIRDIGNSREQNSPKPKNIGERHVIVGEIHENLKTSFKKLSLVQLGNMLSIYRTEQLYPLHSVCKQAKNYAAMFWWHFKK
jgi:hypothetical protein